MAHAAANVHPTSADQQVDGLLLLAQAEGSLVVRNGRIDGPSPVQDGGQKAIRQREIRCAVAVWPDRGHQPATRPAGRVEATKRLLGSEKNMIPNREMIASNPSIGKSYSTAS